MWQQTNQSLPIGNDWLSQHGVIPQVEKLNNDAERHRLKLCCVHFELVFLSKIINGLITFYASHILLNANTINVRGH